VLTGLIAVVWLVNGLVCKTLNMVPRHQLIVGEILGTSQAEVFTKLIGLGETLVFIWIVSGVRSRLCAFFQMALVLSMNVIEFITVPGLLLFGRINIVFALIFIVVIYANEFWLNGKTENYVPGQ
jgi:hypothetical protein